MELPETLLDLQTIIDQPIDQTDRQAERQKELVQQYSYPGVMKGRPLSNVMIIMAGQSGVGKSTTINRLFNDDTLCQISGSKSETSEVHQCTKSMVVKSVDPAISSSLTFVDVPGSIDTDVKRETSNQAKIVSFRKHHPSLQNRSFPFNVNIYRVAKKVYPNLVLFVFNSTDKRMDGPNSSLIKSLKMLADANIVDKKNSNLLVVGTHAASLPRLKKRFEEQTALVTDIIQKAVHDTLTISKVKVLFVENEPEDNGLEKSEDSDFYSLPDGTLSHLNLVTEMFATFRSAGDKLGNLLTSWYFHSKCPDRSTKAINTVFVTNDENMDYELSEAAKSIKTNLNLDSQINVVPTFEFHSLGYAYCPVTESKKSHYVLNNYKQHILTVGQNSKFLIPEFGKPYKSKQTNFRKLSYETKEAYEFSKKSQYGLDVDIMLKVGVSSSGKWVRGAQSQSQESEVCLLSEVCLATIQVDNPEEYMGNDIIIALQQLPSSFSQEPEKFNEFFSKFGSHFVNKVTLGGSIRMDCKIKTANYDSNMESKIEAKANGVFSAIVGGSYSTDSARKELESIGISDARITISGGVPPMVTSLMDLTQQQFQHWVKTVESDPTELENNLSLYPYYNLSQCTHKAALRDATIAYLQQSLKTVVVKRRDDIAKKALEEAMAVDEGSKCFPEFTMVQTANGNSKKISELKVTDMLTTLKFGKTEQFHTKLTRFCTFLHKNSNETAQFLCLDFSNSKSLRVTRDHLLFSYCTSQGPRAILAGSLKIGDAMVFVDMAGDVSFPKIVDITVEYHVGVFSPLTSNGTFLADGFLVTCYADITSFNLAYCAMAPLQLWHTIKQTFTLQKRSIADVDRHKVPSHDKSGIHEYANLLMVLRKLLLK